MTILHMINKKKVQILLRNVVYSSHYNERDSNEGETSVCLCVSQWGCFCFLRLVLAKPLCRCVQYAISSDGIITLTLKYLKERPLTVVESLGSDNRLILTVFSICVAGQSVQDYFLSSIHLKMYFNPLLSLLENT